MSFCRPTSDRVLKLGLTRFTKSQKRASSPSRKGLSRAISRVICQQQIAGHLKLIPDAPTRHRSRGQFPLLIPKAFHSSLLEE